MRNRAAQLGGEIRIVSETNAGSHIVLMIPLKRRQADGRDPPL
jgi:signal transduction histidine kinase